MELGEAASFYNEILHENGLHLSSMNEVFESGRNEDATLYIGNLSKNVDEKLLWELCIQAGPVKNLVIKKHSINFENQCFAFVEFESDAVAEYAHKILTTCSLYERPLKVRQMYRNASNMDVECAVYVGNLPLSLTESDAEIIFKSVGPVLKLKLQTLTNNNKERQHALVTYASYENAEAAIAKFNGFIMGKNKIKVTYAYKNNRKDLYNSEAEQKLRELRRDQSKLKTEDGEEGSD